MGQAIFLKASYQMCEMLTTPNIATSKAIQILSIDGQTAFVRL